VVYGFTLAANPLTGFFKGNGKSITASKEPTMKTAGKIFSSQSPPRNLQAHAREV